MEVDITHAILAAITTSQNKVGGQVPVFYAEDEEEMELVATYLARITLGMVHDLGNGTWVIVKH